MEKKMWVQSYREKFENIPHNRALFGLNVIIKPMRNKNNDYVIGYSESFQYELFNGANKI